MDEKVDVCSIKKSDFNLDLINNDEVKKNLNNNNNNTNGNNNSNNHNNHNHLNHQYNHTNGISNGSPHNNLNGLNGNGRPSNKYNQCKTEWVRLNIGGQHFLTTKTTLCKNAHSFFYKLCQDDPSVGLTTDKVKF